MEIESCKIEKDDSWQCVIGHAGFIKTVDDLYQAMASAAPGIKFGIGFDEASGDCLVRFEGNDDELTDAAKQAAYKIGAGHTFVIFFTGAFPINVVGALRNVPEVAEVYCATANPVEVLTAKGSIGKAVIGVVDGYAPKGFEDEEHVKGRRELLKKFGYVP